MTARPPDDLLARVERLLGSRPVSWQHRAGGWTTNERWSLDLADGRRAFVKFAPNEILARFLRDEYRHLALFDSDVRCEILAWEDGEHPMLVLEDLRDARWPPPWEPGDVERVLAALERVWSLPTDGLPSSENFDASFNGWRTIAEDRTGFLRLEIASGDWLDACLPALVDAERSATFDGDDFIHMDIRSDNMCFVGDRVVLVDWNWAVRGSRTFDLACWLSSLRLEGGPLPEEVAPGLGELAAAIAGFFAKNAPLEPPPTAPHVRRFQLRQLRIALPWACRELGLPMPDVPYARIELADIDRRLADGEISEDEWHAITEETLIDAYLAPADPRAGSGKSGDDETDWRWSRELILDVFPQEGTFLDVGCANGYLMESVHRWGAERGLVVEPYGVDISWRIAALARLRLPQWRDRIYVGNVTDWTPPRRFDVVQAGLDEAPPTRRRELFERLIGYVTPGGVLVFRAPRVTPGGWDVVDELTKIGVRPDGILEAVHPVSGELRRTAWLRAPVA